MKGFRQFLESDDDEPVRIKLRIAKPTPGVENFMQELADISRYDRNTGLTVFINPQGYARYKAKPDPDRNNAVYLTDLVVLPEQAGVGIDFMRAVTKLADKNGIDLVIYPKPIDKDRPEITTERLRKFYSRFGFEPLVKANGKSENMIRKHKDEIEKMAQDIAVDISKFDKEELKKGLEVEKEHMKDKDINVIRQPSDVLKIALAHLREDPKYYTKLKKMENA